jgi:hypothetical protein
MNMTFDQNLFTQIGLDSGSLTMLGAVIHSFKEPGEYRGSVHQEGGDQAVFYVTVDKNSSVAQVDIDLAALNKPSDPCCEGSQNRFSVNPKGYAVFHVSAGAGGYSVHVRRAIEDPKEEVFNSQELNDGDIFSAIIIRPGTYSVVNTHTNARAEVVVSYPGTGKVAYRPPAPVRVEVEQKNFEPRRIDLKPGQGLLFDCKTPSRIKLALLKTDDGPGHSRQTGKRGWKKNALPEAKA